MDLAATTPTPPVRHLPTEAFAGAERVVFEQAATYTAPLDLPDLALGDIDPEVSAGPSEHTRVVSGYYDTADFALTRAGITLRHTADEDEWTVVLPDSIAAGKQPIRREAHYRGSDGNVPAEVRRLLHPRVHDKPIGGVARVVTSRVTTPLINRSGIRIADVVDEHVTATRADAGKEQHRDIVVEVHDLDGVGRRLLEQLHAVLAQAGCRLEPRAAEIERVIGAVRPDGR